VNTLELTIPHPKIRERRFVLIPLAEIAPNLIDPSIGLSVTSLLDDCIDKLGVTVFNTENK
jgi:2-amino-4-hydroxy-6-hydroxymethyldihydropteridine diphosphokinase